MAASKFNTTYLEDSLPNKFVMRSLALHNKGKLYKELFPSLVNLMKIIFFLLLCIVSFLFKASSFASVDEIFKDVTFALRVYSRMEDDRDDEYFEISDFTSTLSSFREFPLRSMLWRLVNTGNVSQRILDVLIILAEFAMITQTFKERENALILHHGSAPEAMTLAALIEQNEVQFKKAVDAARQHE